MILLKRLTSVRGPFYRRALRDSAIVLFFLSGSLRCLKEVQRDAAWRRPAQRGSLDVTPRRARERDGGFLGGLSFDSSRG